MWTCLKRFVVQYRRGARTHAMDLMMVAFGGACLGGTYKAIELSRCKDLGKKTKNIVVHPEPISISLLLLGIPWHYSLGVCQRALPTTAHRPRCAPFGSLAPAPDGPLAPIVDPAMATMSSLVVGESNPP